MPIGSRRTCSLVQSIDYGWRELLASADVVSEGAIRNEPEGPVYYGSTSVLVRTTADGGKHADEEIDRLVQLLSVDPHARVRAVRMACIEAQVRAGGAIGAVKAELAIRRDTRGARIDIDVEARVVQQYTQPQTKSHAR